MFPEDLRSVVEHQIEDLDGWWPSFNVTVHIQKGTQRSFLFFLFLRPLFMVFSVFRSIKDIRILLLFPFLEPLNNTTIKLRVTLINSDEFF